MELRTSCAPPEAWLVTTVTRVRAQRPRAQVSDSARRSLLERFIRAVQAQDKDALLEMLAEGASWTSDGGGKAQAALKVVRGRERVARFIMGVLGRHTAHGYWMFTRC